MGSGYYPIEYGGRNYIRIMRALRVLKAIVEEYSEVIQENDQIDNAVHDGMHQRDFRQGIKLIESCLQHSEEDRLEKANGRFKDFRSQDRSPGAGSV